MSVPGSFSKKCSKFKLQVCMLFWILLYFVFFLQKKLYLLVYPRNMSGPHYSVHGVKLFSHYDCFPSSWRYLSETCLSLSHEWVSKVERLHGMPWKPTLRKKIGCLELKTKKKKMPDEIFETTKDDIIEVNTWRVMTPCQTLA